MPRSRPICQSALAAATALCLGLPALAQSAFPTTEIPTQTADPAIHALLPAAVQESGTLKLVTDANYPPCQWHAEDGTLVGYEVDIWDALAEVMGVKLDVESIEFAGLIPGVQGGRYDLSMECITDRVEREEVVTFVNHSLDYGNAFYFLADNAKIDAADPKTLCGTKTAGQSGTDFVTKLEALSAWCVADGKAAIEVGQFPQQSAVLLALFAGRIDFALSEATAVEEVRANNPVEIETLSNPLEVRNYLGIVVAKENTALADALLAGLKALKANGTYDAIFAKWNIPYAALDEFGINMTTTKPRG